MIDTGLVSCQQMSRGGVHHTQPACFIDRTCWKMLTLFLNQVANCGVLLDD